MDGRPLLGDSRKIQVYIDSSTFDHLLTQKDERTIAILDHANSEYLDFVRSPFETEHDELKSVVEYELTIDNSEIRNIKINREGSRTVMAFGYKIDDIRSIARIISRKDQVSQSELDKITTVFIQAVFNQPEKSNIYISNDELLLKNRLWFEAHFPGCPLNIMSIEEGSVFLDLFFKRLGKYYIRSRYSTNKGNWYWLSMRLKIPHYHVRDPVLDALATRLCYALMALDEVGIQHYSGVDNDTMDSTLYHFNYLITLITGILDNLALKTNEYLHINFSDLRKVSLSGKSGREFLREIGEKNPSIRKLINSHVDFINLVFCLRQPVIHREGLPKTGFVHRDQDVRWTANLIRIPKEIRYCIQRCGDLDSSYDPFSRWGVYELRSEFFLEPYYFSMQALAMLTEFVDGYLVLLGYPSFVENQKKIDDDFTRTLAIFEKYRLGHR